MEQVRAAEKATDIELSAEDIKKIEAVAAETGLDTRGSWESPMM